MDSDNLIKELERKRLKFLLDEEESWRQKCRATWLQKGDRNTKFFHHFATYRKNKKAIWEMKDEPGVTHTGQKDIEAKAVRYFKLLLGFLSVD